MAQPLNTLVDHFYRHEYGRVTAHLAHRFGTQYMEQVEDAVQEALYKAMQSWGAGKVPDSPTAWVVRTAQNSLLDSLRRQHKFQEKHAQEWLRQTDTIMEAPQLEEELTDDTLRMMFACCHPDLREEYQVYLTLKILCGLNNREVARALLRKEDTVAKGYTRAKEQLRTHKIELTVPLGANLSHRLDSVLRVVYLLFNEGYTASVGQDLLRLDLCAEAIRLCELILERPLLRKPQVHSLMALMLYQASRFEARQAADGTLLTLEQQDRSRWNQNLISQANQHLNKASAFGQVHDYTLQAAMAGIHALAPDFESTNWDSLLTLYDLQVQRNPNPVIQLNRAVVLQRVHGPAAALKTLDALSTVPELQRYYLLYAIRAEAHAAMGEIAAQREDLERALSLTQNEHEKRFLQNKLARL